MPNETPKPGKRYRVTVKETGERLTVRVKRVEFGVAYCTLLTPFFVGGPATFEERVDACEWEELKDA